MLGGDIFTDFALNQANRRTAEAAGENNQLRSLAQQYADLYGEMILANAENLGLRYALAEQVKKLDPGNPLLLDQMLIERLRMATIAAFEVSNRSWDAAREAGRTFPIPGREAPKLQSPTLLKSDPEQIKLAYAGVIALRNALSEQLKRFDPQNPLLKDLALQERIRNNAITAYKDGGDNFDAAREVGRTIQFPGSS